MNQQIMSVYLNKESHYPPIDNQGQINSCMSQSFTYIQMTNAVARKINSLEWTPAAMPSACFSPRFTYLLARSNPFGIYDFLKDHGCLTTDVCVFQKDDGGGSIEFDGDIPIKKTVAWNVAPGEFKKALQYRITGFEAVSLGDLAKQDLINKIKKNLQDGNIVVSTTKLKNWLQVELSNDCGVHGKKGDTVIVAARRYIPSGHSFAIVGYDDNIEVKFAGISFKGAFLITCGYGSVWMNQGYCWMLYDAIFPKSQYDIMNSKDIYTGRMFLTSYYGNIRVFSSAHLSDEAQEIQEFMFIPVGELEIDGRKFPTYRIQNPINKKYLGISRCENSMDERVEFSDKGKDAEIWGIVSYRELTKWENFEAEYDPFYENCYWIFSAEHYQRDPTSRCFLDSGLDFYNVGRKIGHSRFNCGDYPQAKSWLLENFSVSCPFTSTLGIHSKDEKLLKHRTYALRDFWFVDWKKDVEIGLPELMVDLELETVDRESFEVRLLRFDRDGQESSYIPALFRTPHTQYVEGNDVMSFSGEINTDKPEKGFFTFQYSDLLCISENRSFEDYRWGIEIKSKNNHPVILKSLSLINSKDKILASVQIESGSLSIYNKAVTFMFDI